MKSIPRFAYLFLCCFTTFSSAFLSAGSRFTSDRHITSTETCSLLTASQTMATDTKTAMFTSRNIFHEYDKPIVLIGMSSEKGNELNRLANYLIQTPLKTSQLIPLMDDTGNLRPIQDIVEHSHGPDIAVIDFRQVQTGKDSNQMTQVDLSDLVKAFCESGHLAIYVNVEPSSSEMSKEARALKEQIEESVLVPNSDYELCIRDEGTRDEKDTTSSWEHIEWEMIRLLARARLIPPIPGDKTRTSNTAHLTMGDHTFFLSLSFPEITQVEPFVESMCADVDAMEYRTDLLDCRDSRFDLLYGMQKLRRYCRPHTRRSPALPFVGSVIEDCMPIVYTVRTANQAGTYPDDEKGIESMFQLLQWGLRGGVEVLDVESAWDSQKTSNLLDRAEERYSSQILGSHHVVGKEVSTEEAVLFFQKCALNGRAHGAKVVLSITDESRDRMAYEAALIAAELAEQDGNPVIPHISLVLGDVGQFSRVINFPFTPVTHESLPFKAAPGQMTSSEIMTTRLLTNIFEKKTYAILGHNIAYSVSPQMHGAAFAATKLPHQYVRVDVPTVEEFVQSDFFKSTVFGGTSVTIPHKQAIIPYVDVMSDAARAIGSVNTIIAKEEFVEDDFKRVIYGDNTDWRGIYNPLNRLLGSNVDHSLDYALILGAGGTARAAAYVARKLGLQCIYYNRTPSKAQDLVESFGGTVVTSLDEQSSQESIHLGDILRKTPGSNIRVVISTLPAAAEFVLPPWLLLLDGDKPIIFDVNYKPYYTELLRQAEATGCSFVRGSEMLWEQGVGQFELWTGRSAPYRVMKQVVLDNCQDQ
ncbi:3-dehydroquinate dehydratase / shikimate dehydrogenase [Fistulifera solaris]|uniref:3-dehydroquinate dehydratase / shikimate dehydrogenase n=1 Tax=Fistulifera solaris TaxID=1519565 RepID=A0A1Z5K1N7_FISSO|nr:3-dehydroquinate dehydratase / shikimate dehydrogenase [Fistulifera solaris]|eukprot:GAX19938.1 3-dehydroquinate dehydratase / shikimate dehydrogenase [Fistulifera solaris]